MAGPDIFMAEQAFRIYIDGPCTWSSWKYWQLLLLNQHLTATVAGAATYSMSRLPSWAYQRRFSPVLHNFGHSFLVLLNIWKLFRNPVKHIFIFFLVICFRIGNVVDGPPQVEAGLWTHVLLTTRADHRPGFQIYINGQAAASNLRFTAFSVAAPMIPGAGSYAETVSYWSWTPS